MVLSRKPTRNRRCLRCRGTRPDPGWQPPDRLPQRVCASRASRPPSTSSTAPHRPRPRTGARDPTIPGHVGAPFAGNATCLVAVGDAVAGDALVGMEVMKVEDAASGSRMIAPVRRLTDGSRPGRA
jgi:biotin carboxyl carrier protein